MPVIKQRMPWTSQPQVPVRIDWSNADSSGLVGGFLLPSNGLGGEPITTDMPKGVDGKYNSFKSNSSAQIVTIPNVTLPETTGATIYLLAKRYGSQPDGGFGVCVYMQKTSDVNDSFVHFMKDSGERVRFNTTSDDDSSNYWETTTNWPINEWQVGAYVYSSGSVPEIYRNGIAQSLSSSGGALSGTLKKSAAAQLNYPTLRLNGAIAGLLVFNTAHTKDRLIRVSNNLFNVLKP